MTDRITIAVKVDELTNKLVADMTALGDKEFSSMCLFNEESGVFFHSETGKRRFSPRNTTSGHRINSVLRGEDDETDNTTDRDMIAFIREHGAATFLVTLK
jgi:hypothetical protein